jgi:predicted ATPase/DNA-binding winged helix-turn-helix (wHTH) protein
MTSGSESRADEIFSFGPFRLFVSARMLTRCDKRVVVGGRSLEVLIALVERAGEIVSRRDLMTRVWPDVTVEEANLRGQIASLRKTLGDGRNGARYIINLPARGYSFSAPVQRLTAAQPPEPAAISARPNGSRNFPARLARMFGRDQAVGALSSLVRSHRFVSIVGSGGMGKTTVAVSVGHALLEEFPDAIFFVDLAAITEVSLVPSAIASTLGLALQLQDPVTSLLAFLLEMRIVLILDGCEHVIEAVATFTERLFNEAPNVHLLVTSREALRVEGEHVYLLMPLDDPPDRPELTAAEALASPAVQLFMERARASGLRAEMNDSEAPVVATICRRLDGIPLAIELVASRVGVYGIRGTAGLLDSRFPLIWQGRRTALPRHQTLQAMLDWSYDLLSEREQRVFRRLSVFVGHFVLEAVLWIAAEADSDTAMVTEAVARLVDKSLVWASTIAGSVYHRLPDTMRTYAAAKLAEGGEEDVVARRHALYYSRSLKLDEIETLAFGGVDIGSFSANIGNIRAALELSFSQTGDTAVGVELAARAAPLFLRLSLLGECQRWCEHGLAALSEADQGTKSEMRLQKAFAFSTMFTRGNRNEVRVAIERGLCLAEALADEQEQLHLLAGLNVFFCRTGDYRAALSVAERSAAVAAGGISQGGIVMTDQMLTVAHHLVGDQRTAQRNCELQLIDTVAPYEAHIDYFDYDHRVRAMGAFARVLWLRGLPDRGWDLACRAIDEGAKRDRPVTQCIALIFAIPVLLWCGGFEAAEQRIKSLISCATKYSLRPFRTFGLAFSGELLVARDEDRAGIELLRSSLSALEAERFRLLTSGFYRSLAEGLARIGQTEEALAIIAETVKRATAEGGTFDTADLLRTQGEILMALGEPHFLAAQDLLLSSLDWARRQSALGWELRSAITLARLWIQLGRGEQARTMLSEVSRQFKEGFATADLKTARALLE